MPEYNIKIDSEEDASNTEKILNALLQTNIVEKIHFTRVDNKTTVHFTMQKKPSNNTWLWASMILTDVVIIVYLLTRTT